MKTFKSKISSFLNKVSKNILGNPSASRNLIKPIIVKILNIVTLEKGICVNIGGQAVDFYEDQNQVNPMGGLILTDNIKNNVVAVSKRMITLDKFCKDMKIKPELIK